MALTVVKQMKDLTSGSSGGNFLAECPYEGSTDDDFPHISGSNTPLLLSCNDPVCFYLFMTRRVSLFRSVHPENYARIFLLFLQNYFSHRHHISTFVPECILRKAYKNNVTDAIMPEFMVSRHVTHQLASQ
jgi:hypothetical protein